MENKLLVSFKLLPAIKLSLGIEVNMFRIHKKGTASN
jgi:hypothetical protein